MKPTRLLRVATAVLGTVAGAFGASVPAQAEDAPPGDAPAKAEGRAEVPPAAPQTPAQPPAARAPAPPPTTPAPSVAPAPPQVRPIPPQPARVRAVRAKRAEERRDDS